MILNAFDTLEAQISRDYSMRVFGYSLAQRLGGI